MTHSKILQLRKKVASSPINFTSNITRAAQKPNIELDDRLIKQYFCIFGVPDDYGTIPMPGCFAKSITDRGPESKANYKITVLWMHDQRDPLCIPTVLKEDEIGLYGEYSPDPIPSGDRCVIQVRSGTINNGSYGFNYVWDKMVYDDKVDKIRMYECNLFELSPVTIGSQQETFVVRNRKGELVDKTLDYETEMLIKQLPAKHQLEMRHIIDRHRTLAKNEPLDLRQKIALKNKIEPEQDSLDFNYLIKNFKLK